MTRLILSLVFLFVTAFGTDVTHIPRPCGGM